jgi:hypothetical protein
MLLSRADEWELEIKLYTFLISTLNGGKWLYSCSGRFIPAGTAAGTHWLGLCNGSRAGLDAMAKKTPTLAPAEN